MPWAAPERLADLYSSVNRYFILGIKKTQFAIKLLIGACKVRVLVRPTTNSKQSKMI
jgi:hypothetical protein